MCIPNIPANGEIVWAISLRVPLPGFAEFPVSVQPGSLPGGIVRSAADPPSCADRGSVERSLLTWAQWPRGKRSTITPINRSLVASRNLGVRRREPIPVLEDFGMDQARRDCKAEARAKEGKPCSGLAD